MKKEDKGLIIGQLTEIVKEYPNFYLTDIEALDAEKTSKLRRECFIGGCYYVWLLQYS